MQDEKGNTAVYVGPVRSVGNGGGTEWRIAEGEVSSDENFLGVLLRSSELIYHSREEGLVAAHDLASALNTSHGVFEIFIVSENDVYMAVPSGRRWQVVNILSRQPLREFPKREVAEDTAQLLSQVFRDSQAFANAMGAGPNGTLPLPA